MQEDCSIMRVIIRTRPVRPSVSATKKNAVQTTTTRPCHLEKVLATDTVIHTALPLVCEAAVAGEFLLTQFPFLRIEHG